MSIQNAPTRGRRRRSNVEEEKKDEDGIGEVAEEAILQSESGDDVITCYASLSTLHSAPLLDALPNQTLLPFTSSVSYTGF